jgi:hypothetical protein
MLRRLRVRIVDECDSQIVAAKELEVDESRLSKIINEHVRPTRDERKKIIARFGPAVVKPSSPRTAQSVVHRSAQLVTKRGDEVNHG